MCKEQNTFRTFLLTSRAQNRCQAVLGRLEGNWASREQPGLWHPPPPRKGRTITVSSQPPCHEGSPGTKFNFFMGLVDEALLSALSLTGGD